MLLLLVLESLSRRQCDIESYIYMPLIEELQNIPTEKYAKGPELLAHALAIAEKTPQKARILSNDYRKNRVERCRVHVDRFHRSK